MNIKEYVNKVKEKLDVFLKSYKESNKKDPRNWSIGLIESDWEGQEHPNDFQAISDMMGDNQFAAIKVICMDCGKDFDLKLKRTSETEIKIIQGAIGIRREKGRILFKCPECETNQNCYRVVGYFHPINKGNDSKQEEFRMCKVNDIENEQAEQAGAEQDWPSAV